MCYLLQKLPFSLSPSPSFLSSPHTCVAIGSNGYFSTGFSRKRSDTKRSFFIMLFQNRAAVKLQRRENKILEQFSEHDILSGKRHKLCIFIIIIKSTCRIVWNRKSES